MTVNKTRLRWTGEDVRRMRLFADANANETALAYRAVETLPGTSFVDGAAQTRDAALVTASAEMKTANRLVDEVRPAIGKRPTCERK